MQISSARAASLNRRPNFSSAAIAFASFQCILFIREIAARNRALLPASSPPSSSVSLEIDPTGKEDARVESFLVISSERREPKWKPAIARWKRIVGGKMHDSPH